MYQLKKLLPSTLIFKYHYPGPITGSIALMVDFITIVVMSALILFSCIGLVILTIDIIITTQEIVQWLKLLLN